MDCLADLLYVCPISMEVVEDPVVCADGHSYERAFIERWVRFHHTSPLTNMYLDGKMLIPNRTLKGMSDAVKRRIPQIQEQLSNRDNMIAALEVQLEVEKQSSQCKKEDSGQHKAGDQQLLKAQQLAKEETERRIAAEVMLELLGQQQAEQSCENQQLQEELQQQKQSQQELQRQLEASELSNETLRNERRACETLRKQAQQSRAEKAELELLFESERRKAAEVRIEVLVQQKAGIVQELSNEMSEVQEKLSQTCQLLREAEDQADDERQRVHMAERRADCAVAQRDVQQERADVAELSVCNEKDRCRATEVLLSQKAEEAQELVERCRSTEALLSQKAEAVQDLLWRQVEWHSHTQSLRSFMLKVAVWVLLSDVALATMLLLKCSDCSCAFVSIWAVHVLILAWALHRCQPLQQGDQGSIVSLPSCSSSSRWVRLREFMKAALDLEAGVGVAEPNKEPQRRIGVPAEPAMH